MGDQDVRAALEAVIVCARSHLDAVIGGGEEPSDAAWRSFVELNNATARYDRLLDEQYGEVTPWDVDEIDSEGELLDEEQDELPPLVPGPDSLAISVRQRRDYLVPDVERLLEAARIARSELHDSADVAGSPNGSGPIESVAEALGELLHASDGSLDQLEGVIVLQTAGVTLVDLRDRALTPDDYPEPDEADRLFVGAGTPPLCSLYEQCLDED